MTKPTIIVSEHEAANGSLRSYTTGFALSIALTLLAYGAVTHAIWAGWALIAFIMSVAVIQLLVQLYFFLHLSKESNPRWNLVVFAFMLIVVLILVIGSIWIMVNLNYHHDHGLSPAQTSKISFMTRVLNSNAVFKTYYQLTKPGIIRGNVMTLLAGFLLAADGHIDGWLLLAAAAGSSLIIAAACVTNNYIDRDIDQKMARTKKRALVSGDISNRNALMFAAILLAGGIYLLGAFTNLLTLGLGLAGFFFYVVVYSIAKRHSVHSTLIGSISGAIPPVAGYCAVTNQLDGAALLLFLILAAWQMPHFYAIATYRQKDYAAAGLPVMPVKYNVRTTRQQMIGYIVVFAIVTSLLTIQDHTGVTYLVIMLGLSLAWLRLAVRGFQIGNEVAWARKVFFFSLLVISTFSGLLAANSFLP